MKPVVIGGGALAVAILLTLAVTAGGCKSRPFAKKPSPSTVPAADVVQEQVDESQEVENVHRHELNELLSIE